MIMKNKINKVIKNKIHRLLTGLIVTSVCMCACSVEINDDIIEKKEKCPYEEFMVVDVFDSTANYQGIQSGWFGEIVKQKFNMELNIIAPNVSGGGDTLFETRVAAGKLGDLIICNGENGILKNLVNAGLIYDMEDDLKGKDIMRFETAINNLNKETGCDGIYAIPSEVSTNEPTVPSEGNEPVYGPYIRWDLYKQLGYPKLSTLEDLLPVLKDMQSLKSYSDKGLSTYAFSFFKDWDDNMMNAIKQPCCFYGYDEYGFVLAKADGSDYQNIMDKDSLYVRMLKFYFNANQMGLVDPDSLNQSYADCFEKYVNGQILFSPWPWLGQSAYNTIENAQKCKGFMVAPIEDMQIYSYGCNPNGRHECVIAVGSQAKDPQRLADFIDWLYSDEGICVNGASLSGATAGPEGLAWEMKEDGPYLTEFGIEALYNGGSIEVPKEYGGGTWVDGSSALNYKTVALTEKNKDGYYYYYSLWDSVKELNKNALTDDWSKVTGAETTMEYLINNNMLLVEKGNLYVAPAENSEQITIRNQCKKVIQNYSWDMVFAKDEKEFNMLLDEMIETVKSYGYDEILEYDMLHAKAEKNTK